MKYKNISYQNNVDQETKVNMPLKLEKKQALYSQ